jgi:hypothetical protein
MMQQIVYWSACYTISKVVVNLTPPNTPKGMLDGDRPKAVGRVPHNT